MRSSPRDFRFETEYKRRSEVGTSTERQAESTGPRCCSRNKTVAASDSGCQFDAALNGGCSDFLRRQANGLGARESCMASLNSIRKLNADGELDRSMLLEEKSLR